MPNSADVIIIGSGPAGANAAWPLVMAGHSVIMLDGGRTGPAILSERPAEDFETMRRHVPDQYRWFVGEDFSAIPISGMEGGLGGGMTSGNRSYVTRDTESLLPLRQENTQVIQSLAKGGLGASWGATSAFLDDQELSAMGLSPQEMHQHYDAVAARIGMSGPVKRANVQPPLRLDHHAEALLKASKKQREQLKQLHTRVEQPCSAVLTEPLGNRKAYTYSDMEYYTDPEAAVYRPQYTVDELRSHQNFTYVPHCIVETFADTADGCTVQAQQNGIPATYTAKRVILASGAIGSARIALRSLNISSEIPLLAKPHLFMACLHPRMLGKAGPKQRSSLCQLIAVDETRRDDGMESATAQLYSYRALLLFRLLGSLPLPVPVPDAMRVLSLLSPMLLIADVRFPDTLETHLRLQLSDRMLHIRRPPRNLLQEFHSEISRIKKTLRAIGLIVARTVPLPEASASHYAGTIPVARAGDNFMLSTDTNGQLNQCKNVFVADASVFRTLPAKPHTLTLMAHANRVGTIVSSDLKKA